MGLISKTVMVTLCSNNIKYYESLGYKMPRKRTKNRTWTVPRGTKIEILVEDLQKGSNSEIRIQCDNCNKKLKIKWKTYNKYLHSGKYYCVNCANELFSKKEYIKTRLKNGKSFYEWCIEHNKQDILDRWDYDLNKCSPKEINYGTKKKYYFKCPRNIHKSESHIIKSFTSGQEGTMNCKQCNSFAQWGIDNIGKDFLDKYWDYEKNKDIDPYSFDRGSKKQIWVKCQENRNHGSYKTTGKVFVKGCRCQICKSSKGEQRIQKYLINNKLSYIAQKEFKGLVGLGGNNLSYDFYLPQYKLLVEYQGEFHDGTAHQQSKKDFEKQQKHDRRKKEYAKANNIKLLEIWYNCFDDIEFILDEVLSQLSNQEDNIKKEKVI